MAMLVPLAGAAAGLWLMIVSVREHAGRGAILRPALLAAALVGVLWVGWMAGFFDWRLNY